MESSRATGKARRKPFKVRIIFAPIYVPLFFIAAAVSIRWTYIQKSRQRRRERTFAEQMKKAGRLMHWQEFKRTEGTGTAIGEHLSTKGPFRLWWTPDDIPATSPHKWKREHHFALMESEFLPFFEWCYKRYKNPQTGAARLVTVPEQERKQLRDMFVDTPHFVSTCSFHSLRAKQSPD